MWEMRSKQDWGLESQDGFPYCEFNTGNLLNSEFATDL